jgi:hypothetical protein
MGNFPMHYYSTVPIKPTHDAPCAKSRLLSCLLRLIMTRYRPTRSLVSFLWSCCVHNSRKANGRTTSPGLGTWTGSVATVIVCCWFAIGNGRMYGVMSLQSWLFSLSICNVCLAGRWQKGSQRKGIHFKPIARFRAPLRSEVRMP